MPDFSFGAFAKKSFIVKIAFIGKGLFTKEPDRLRGAGMFPLGSSKNRTASMYGISLINILVGEPVVVKGHRSSSNLDAVPTNSPWAIIWFASFDFSSISEVRSSSVSGAQCCHASKAASKSSHSHVMEKIDTVEIG